ncbi:SMP-30/gluconolactonase/LRE family protein [Pantanalinema rosaneae CENA516]|uniref:SMP-30/gluconolactonase/LRE family protein n=1 Tax=Pantanalinema rosaneae TaxID=1620701 RepID=UPI003D700F09
MPSAPQNILTVRARLGEGPCWHSGDRVLYWVDIYNHRVHQFNPATGEHQWFEVGEVVGCLAPAGAQRLIMAMNHQLAFLDTCDGTVTPIVTIAHSHPETRFNDGKCDAAGRFWFGSVSVHENTACLYSYDATGTVKVKETGLTISNGLGWSPDNQTFYLTDSARKTIYAYKFDLASGDLSDRRVLIDLTAESFEPDGLTVDQEGCIWSAMWNGWCVIRFDPAGQEMMRVPMPVQRPTCCVFGNPDRMTLYITSASIGLSETEIQASFYSGDLFSLPTEVTGLPTYAFQG